VQRLQVEADKVRELEKDSGSVLGVCLDTAKAQAAIVEERAASIRCELLQKQIALQDAAEQVQCQNLVRTSCDNLEISSRATPKECLADF
jgi:hypothetical protein